MHNSQKCVALNTETKWIYCSVNWTGNPKTLCWFLHGCFYASIFLLRKHKNLYVHNLYEIIVVYEDYFYLCLVPAGFSVQTLIKVKVRAEKNIYCHTEIKLLCFEKQSVCDSIFPRRGTSFLSLWHFALTNSCSSSPDLSSILCSELWFLIFSVLIPPCYTTDRAPPLTGSLCCLCTLRPLSVFV